MELSGLILKIPKTLLVWKRINVPWLMFVLVQTIKKRINVIVKIIQQQSLFVPPAMCNTPGSLMIVLGNVVSIYTSIFI